MRALQNAEYQHKVIMPSAREGGCTCPFDESDYQDFIDSKWHHDTACPAKLYECLPNVALLEVMRYL